jgi:hypothetical protein
MSIQFPYYYYYYYYYFKFGLKHYATYALSLRAQDTHRHQKAQVINDKTKASPALVPQLQLWHHHLQVYVQSVGVLHSQLP